MSLSEENSYKIVELSLLKEMIKKTWYFRVTKNSLFCDHNFKLRDAIVLIKALKGRNAILFSSTKSETDDLLEAFDVPITKRLAYQASSGEGKKYTELMYVMGGCKY